MFFFSYQTLTDKNDATYFAALMLLVFAAWIVINMFYTLFSASPGQRFPDLMRITDPDRNGLSSVRLYIISGDSDQRFEVIWSEPILNNNAAMVGLQVK